MHAVELRATFGMADVKQAKRELQKVTTTLMRRYERGGFIEDNPGKDRGNIYWFEQEAVEEFLADRFSQDAEFAPGMMELADERLSALPPVPEGEYDRYRHERIQWTGTRLKAMATLGNVPDALRDYADSTWALPASGISGSQCFYSCSNALVGGNGTVWSSSNTSYTYFRIDTASTPGYLTAA